MSRVVSSVQAVSIHWVIDHGFEPLTKSAHAVVDTFGSLFLYAFKYASSRISRTYSIPSCARYEAVSLSRAVSAATIALFAVNSGPATDKVRMVTAIIASIRVNPVWICLMIFCAVFFIFLFEDFTGTKSSPGRSPQHLRSRHRCRRFLGRNRNYSPVSVRMPQSSNRL